MSVVTITVIAMTNGLRLAGRLPTCAFKLENFLEILGGGLGAHRYVDFRTSFSSPIMPVSWQGCSK